MKPRPLVAILLAVTIGNAAGRLEPALLRAPLYQPEGDALVRHNGDRYNNRPLYCNQVSAIVLTGDRPLVRCGGGSTLAGTFIAAFVRGGRATWLHDFADVTARYRADRMTWTLADAAIGATVLTLDAVPPAAGAGMALRLRVADAQPGDRLIWVCGGAQQQKEGLLSAWDVTTGAWSATPGPRQKLMARGFVPDDCLGNRVTLAGERFTVQAVGARSGANGACSVPTTLALADAGAWAAPLALVGSAGGERPAACGVVDLTGRPEVCWALLMSPPARWQPADVFAAGLRRADDLGHRVTVDTPDARLNAEVAVSNAVMDGVYRDGIFTHSGMRWGVALLGWRTLFGGTAYGWHERVKAQARTCLAHQLTESPKTRPVADLKTGLSCQSLDSRLFGKGRVDYIQPWHYDMQSQFFDQLIHAWRWTGDAELEKLLRPALELHLEWLHDCFDPADTGLYESYANTWPTDNQWYNGGGTAEETAYAYNGHRAALELARRAGDTGAVARHEARLAHIRAAFCDKLWLPDQGYVGSYVEQGGHRRTHTDSWLYAIFCPIDAGLLSTSQAASALDYTRWGLEREHMPYGGERCWTSNWVPSVWSLREMWPGDNYQLALAYQQTGLADEGWELLRGTFPAMAFYGPVPGDLGYPNGGTDFNDCASMFGRTVVEGLYGYRPDYPHGVVTLAPQLPSDWEHAGLKTPDVTLDVGRTRVHVELARPAALDLRLPVRGRKVTAATANGAPVKWELLPGYGCSVAKLELPPTSAVTVELTLAAPDGELPQLLRPTHVAHAPAAEPGAPPPPGARWACLDLAPQLNADIRTLFEQRYLSPRPATCSLRLATDGYSTWQMSLGAKNQPPVIDLDHVAGLLDKAGRLLAPPGVPFAWGGAARNVALTSLWDNWPRQVTLPVGQTGEALWLLLCGFTNPMQGRIANAELRLTYADGGVDQLELVPPFNFWSLCPFGRADYDYARDGFALPKVPPPTVQLGHNCRAVLLCRRLRPGVALTSVTLECLSPEVMIGVMGASVLGPVP